MAFFGAPSHQCSLLSLALPPLPVVIIECVALSRNWNFAHSISHSFCFCVPLAFGGVGFGGRFFLRICPGSTIVLLFCVVHCRHSCWLPPCDCLRVRDLQCHSLNRSKLLFLIFIREILPFLCYLDELQQEKEKVRVICRHSLATLVERMGT